MTSRSLMSNGRTQTRTVASSQDMSSPMKLLTDKWQTSKKTSCTRLRKPAFDDKVHTTYVKQVQPVVLREVRKKNVRHIVQPIIQEIDDEPHHDDEEFTRPVVFRQIQEEVPDHIRDQIIQNQYTIASMTDNKFVEEAEDEEHFEDDHVQEIEHVENSYDVQPIIQRKINRRVHVKEIQPVHETVHQIDQVGDVEIKEPVTANEWQLSKTNKDGFDEGSSHEFEDIE